MMHTEDQETIARFLRRESEAVQIIEGWIARAASPFRRRLGEQWEDALQEILLEVTRLLERGSFRGESSLKTYLWRVANHACLRQIRAQTRVNWVDIDALAEQGGPPEDSPLDQLLQKERMDILRRVMAEMPAECRNLLQMIVEGSSYQEMSRRLGAPEGALRVKALRCRKKAAEMRDQFLGKKQRAAM